MEPRELLLAGVVPGAVAFAVLVGTWLLCLGTKEERQPPWAAPLAFGLAYFPADYAINAWPQLWPPDPTYRLPHIALLLMVVGIVESTIKPAHPKRRRTLHVVTLIAMSLLILQPLQRIQSLWIMLLWVTGTVIVTWILTSFLSKQAREHKGWRVPAMLALIPLAASLVLLFGTSAKGAQQAGSLVAMLAAAALAAAFITRQNIAPGAITVFVGMLVAMLLSGMNYANVNPVAVAFLLIAPFLLNVGWKSKWQGRNNWIPIIVQATAIAIPLLIAVGIAYATKPE